MKRTAAILVALTCYAASASAGAPQPSRANDAIDAATQAEHNRFNGKWQVVSASYQFGGSRIYDFDDGKLVIESRSLKSKFDPTPQPPYVERYNYRFDMTKNPKQLILVADAAKAVESPHIYEFREGRLWMDRYDPQGASALVPGRNSGWLEGLAPIK